MSTENKIMTPQEFLVDRLFVPNMVNGEINEAMQQYAEYYFEQMSKNLYTLSDVQRAIYEFGAEDPYSESTIEFLNQLKQSK